MTKGKIAYKVKIRENECSFECSGCRQEIVAEIKDNKVDHICASCGNKTEVDFRGCFFKQELLNLDDPKEAEIAMEIFVESLVPCSPGWDCGY